VRGGDDWSNRPATSIRQAARSACGTAVAAIISWAGTDDRGDLSPMKPITPPPARGRAAPDAAAVAGFVGGWRSLEHLRPFTWVTITRQAARVMPVYSHGVTSPLLFPSNPLASVCAQKQFNFFFFFK
jgi:hypothetical protein